MSANVRGAVFMIVAMIGFSVNDALAKLASEAMNMGQVMLVRGVFASCLVLALAWRGGALPALPWLFHRAVLIRVVGEVGATVTFLLALANLPIANVSAVLQALPLAITMAAALVLGERVGWRRWLAITAGFAGVLIIVRPGLDGFSGYSVLALISVGFCTLRDLATRSVPQRVPSILVSSATAISVTVTGAILISPMGGWTPMTADSVVVLAVAAALVLVGYQFVILAMRTGEISFIAPFRYTALLASILLGMLMFADIPDLAMISGSLVIVGSGLYAFYRERAVGRQRPAAESTTPAMAADGM